MTRSFTPFLVAFVAASATAQSPRVRDSAGVRIVENGARLKAPIAFRLGDKPSFDAGGLQADPAGEFNSHNYYLKGARLSDGRVVIIDATRIHFFSPEGNRLRTVGRQGSGPGEYRQATDLCVVRGDTVLIGQTRGLINRLTGTGDFVDAIPPIGNGYPEGQFCFDDGTFVTLNRQTADFGKPTPFRVARYSFARPMNTVADFRYPAFDQLILAEVGQAARGNRFYVGEPTSFDIKGYNPDGKLELIIRTADPLVAISADERDKLVPSAQRAGASPSEIEAARKDAIAKSTTRYWPTLGHVMIDGVGRLWVQEWAAHWDPTKPTTWAAFDPGGRLLGRLIIPGAPSREVRSEVMGFGTNEVFFKRIDDDGALHLTIVPILPIR